MQAPPQPAPPRAPRGLSSLLPLVVAVVSVAITLSLWWHERESERARLRATFDNGVRQTATRIEQRVASYEQMLRGLQGLFAAHGSMERETFERYVDTVMTGPDALGLQGFGWLASVDAAALPRHVADQRAHGSPGYVLQPPGARETYAPLDYVAPATASTRDILGVDALADPVRRPALLQSRDSGYLAITARTRLLVDRDSDAVPGFLMVLPVYTPGHLPAAVDERRARLAGWVSSAFRVGDMMSTLYGEAPPGLSLRLHDGADVADDTVMFASGPPTGPEPPVFEAQEYISFAGHPWTLQVRSTPDFMRRHARGTANVILAAGAVLSLMLALLTRQLVTQRARAHAVAQRMTHELRASETRYRRIVDTASEGIWVVDEHHRIAFANPQIARWLGWQDIEMAGRALDDFMDATEAARCRAAFAQAPSERRETLELALRRRDGQSLWASLSFRPVADDEGHPAGALCMLTDISARRGAEERRAALELQLRESQKMEAIGTLAGGIAHDFNNILAAILGNVAAARHEAQSGGVVEPALSQINRAASRARSLVQQILTFSRTQSPVLQPQPLQPIVDEALQLLRVSLPPHVELVVRLPEAPVWVRADATQLQQVVMNLATNAWHALDGRRGRVEVGVGVAARPGGPAAHLWVADDGVGMDEATQARAFEPFFTTRQVGQGTGLGLAVVHGIVSGHGGTIRIESAPRRGSCFDVWLPLAEPPQEPPPPAPPERVVPVARGEHVLCVDDDPAMLMMVEALLQRAGYRVSAFERPQEAAAAVRADPAAFDLLVTDFTMPGMNGLALAQAVQAEAPTLPVIITSGFISDELRAQAAGHGVRALLQKEYTLERLAALAHDVLAEAAQGLALPLAPNGAGGDA